MYGVVLMMAMAAGGESADFGGRGCWGCYGGCYGGGYGGCYGGCYGGGWGYGGCYGGCYGGGYGGCYGGCHGGFYSRMKYVHSGCYGGCYGGGYGGCYGGCYGGGYGGCYGGAVYSAPAHYTAPAPVYSGCYGGGYGGVVVGGCYGGGYGGVVVGGCSGVYPGGGVIISGGGYAGHGCSGGIPVGPSNGGDKPKIEDDKKGKDDKGKDDGKDKDADEVEARNDSAYNGRTAPAKLVVNLPADARLLVDGKPTRSTTTQRVFVTPDLSTRRDYTYTLTAEVMQDGAPVSWTKHITVRGGETTRVTLTPPGGVARR